MTKERVKQFQVLPKVINGGIAGIVGTACIFPIDLCKTRLQNQQPGPDGKMMYNGLIDSFRKTYAAGGFRGLYSGSAVNILLVTPEKVLKLAANDFFRHHLETKSGELSLFREMIAGACAGICQNTVTCPMELLKIQMQDAGRVAARDGTTVKISATKLVLNLLTTKGITGFYKGYGATLLRDVPFSIVYFPGFARLNAMGPRKTDGSGEAVFYWSLVSGLIIGAICAWGVTPCDVVKTRLQLLARGKSETSSTEIPDAFRTIYAEEGLTAFFKGAGCRVVVLAPLFGILQMVYYIGVAEVLLRIDRRSLK